MYRIEYKLDDGKVLLVLQYEHQEPVIPRIGETVRLSSGKKVVKDVQYILIPEHMAEYTTIVVILSHAILN